MSRELQNSPDILARAFGDVLRSVRKERGLSQEELGDESGYHRTYVSLLERGLKSPSLQTIFQLAHALNTPPSKLLADVEGVMREMTP
ncbi:helix-turn-helix domain-containing protein [Desulfonatronum sp. SC1]|uniref:helix-turn-helix domain-containing protein n=1 Tax=Desulfonatronum sp. SC1 TaxID=2109626 RepID=UPI000D324DE1|nr:XRE family transcriptional regulator [Desulfonatronum sp. SC1]